MKKAESLIVSEVLCFVNSHFGLVPNGNISTVLGTFYSEDDLAKAKAVVFDACSKNIPDANNIPRLVKHKGEEKKRKRLNMFDLLFSLGQTKGNKLLLMISVGCR